MFGTAIEQLEESIDQIIATVRSIEDLEVDRLEATEAVLRVERLRERLESAVGSFLSDLDARGAHERDGAYSMANWLAARTGQRRATAGSRMRLARKLRSMPVTDAALTAGEITASHASVLARALNARTVEAFARDEGVGGDLAVTVKMTITEIVGQILARDKKCREVDPTDPRADETTSQRRARALGELCERAAASPKNPARRQPLFTMHTTVDTLAGTGDPDDWLREIEEAWSSAIPSHLASLWSCDCWISDIVIRREDGQPLDCGREIRVANRAMRRALVARDGACCAVPGCDRPVGCATPTTSCGGNTAARPSSTTSCSCADGTTVGSTPATSLSPWSTVGHSSPTATDRSLPNTPGARSTGRSAR